VDNDFFNSIGPPLPTCAMQHQIPQRVKMSRPTRFVGTAGLAQAGLAQQADPPGRRSALPSRADIVAKVENRRTIIFPPKDDVTGDRRSLYSQSRFQGRQ